MKLKMTLDWVIDFGDIDESSDLLPLDDIKTNLETDEGLSHMLACGFPISDIKATVVKVEDIAND